MISLTFPLIATKDKSIDKKSLKDFWRLRSTFYNLFFFFPLLFFLSFCGIILVENETRCFGEIGCLNITREWYHLIHRPFNVFPLPRNIINTRFYLYTPKNPLQSQNLVAEDDKTIKESNFNADWMTKIIIHGFIDTPLSNWVSFLTSQAFLITSHFVF